MARRMVGLLPLLLVAVLVGGCGQRPAGPLPVRALDSPAAPGSLAPRLQTTPGGRAVLSWLEPDDGETWQLRYSTLDGAAWSPPVTLARGTDWFINWADFPSVTPLTAGDWAAYWLVKRPGGTYAYDIALALSADGGRTWAAPFVPHTDDTPTEHGFVSLFPWEGAVGAVWLDGRHMRPDLPGAGTGNEGHGGMSLRYARFDGTGRALAGGEIDELVCECCQTAVAVAAAGPVLAYRDRSPEEIRDIAVRRYTAAGWSDPVILGEDRWQIPGCPVNGPAIAALDQRVVVAWYAAPNRQARVQLAVSRDGGATFGPAVVLDEGPVSGRVGLALAGDGTAFVSWTARTGDGVGEVRLRAVPATGEPGPVQVIAAGPMSRNSGFPQLVLAGDRLVYARPEPGEPARILTAASSLP